MLGAWGARAIRDPSRRRPTTLLSTSMAELRRSPSLESVSSVQSVASMQSAESINSLVSDERGAKPSENEDLNDIDMGRTITSIPVPAHPASDSGQGDDNSSSKIGDWVNTGNDGLEPSSATIPSRLFGLGRSPKRAPSTTSTPSAACSGLAYDNAAAIPPLKSAWSVLCSGLSRC